MNIFPRILVKRSNVLEKIQFMNLYRERDAFHRTTLESKGIITNNSFILTGNNLIF